MQNIKDRFEMALNTIYLGMLMRNLQSLEVKIRLFLLIDELEGDKEASKHNQSLRSLKVGQSVRINQFTNFSYFSELIDKYNDTVLSIDSGLKLCEKVKTLRNTLAHGLAFSFEHSSIPMVLLKFGKPDNGFVKVESMDIITLHWLSKQIRLTKDSNDKVYKACLLISHKKP